MPEFTFEIKGVTLNMNEMNAIHTQYQIFSTAEYIMENYGLDEKTALKKAADVRRRMDKYGLDEETAIDEVL
jgi:hypothetical protein